MKRKNQNECYPVRVVTLLPCYQKTNIGDINIVRSCHQRCSVIKGVLRNFTKSQKNTCARVFFNKVAGLRPVIL